MGSSVWEKPPLPGMQIPRYLVVFFEVIFLQINLECVAYFTHTKVSFNHQQHKLRWKDEKFRDKAIMNKVYTLTLVDVT